MSGFLRYLIAVVLLTIVVGCTPFPLAGAPATAPATFLVTPIEAPPGDLDGLLEVKRWSFHLTLPQADLKPDAAPQDDSLIHLTYTLEVRQAGQAPRVLGQFTLGQASPAEELQVIMFPIDYPDGQPQRWKVVIHGTVSVMDSPMEASQVARYEQPAQRLPDGSFLLMEMAPLGQSIPAPDNPQLVFAVTHEAQP